MKNLNLKTKANDTKAITLVALVISIIVLLILATVSINLVINNGILDKAKTAVDKYSDGEVEEQIKLAQLEYQTAKFTSTDKSELEYMEESLSNTYKTIVSVTKLGSNYKVNITGKDKIYILKYDGTINKINKIEQMEKTDVYGWIEGNTLKLRATNPSNGSYKPYSKSSSIESNWNSNNTASKELVQYIEIEEPIAPSGIMFDNYSNLILINNIENLHTENISTMQFLFYQCNSLKSLNLSSFDTSNVKAMNRMFEGCSNLEYLNISSFDTSKVTTMATMFSGCSMLKNLDLSNFDTGCVENIRGIFASCNGLQNLDLSHWNTINIKSMDSSFSNCKNLMNLNLKNWNTKKVTTMNRLFFGCNVLSNLTLGNDFRIIDGEDYTVDITYMFNNTPNNIQIKTTRDTANNLKTKLGWENDDRFDFN